MSTNVLIDDRITLAAPSTDHQLVALTDDANPEARMEKFSAQSVVSDQRILRNVLAHNAEYSESDSHFRDEVESCMPSFSLEEEESGNAAALWGCGLSVDLGSTWIRWATWTGTDIHWHVENSIPAYVGMTNAGKVLLGHEAKSAAIQNPGNVFHVGELMEKLHRQRTEDPDGLGPPPSVTITSVRNQPQELFVAELLALLLWRVRELAQTQISVDAIEALVLSTPASFGLVQRKTVEEAVQLAGFRRARLLRAPVGAALSRHLLSKDEASNQGQKSSRSKQSCPQDAVVAKGLGEMDEQQVLLIDIGACHMDCALVVIEYGIFEVRWAGGCPLGGANIDLCLAELCLEKAKQSADMLQSQGGKWQRLLLACEKAKRTLTSASTARIHLPRFLDGCDLDVTISQCEMENAIRNSILPNMLQCLDNLIENGGRRSIMFLPSKQVDEVLVLGSAAKMPLIAQSLREVARNQLGVKDLSTWKVSAPKVDAACCNAYGAALQGAILGERRSTSGPLQHLMLIDSCSYAVGIDIDVCEGSPTSSWVVPAHTPIPTTRDVHLRYLRSDQPGAVVHVREACALPGMPSAWLGAIKVVVPQQATPHVKVSTAVCQDSTAADFHCFWARLEVDAAGRLHGEAALSEESCAEGATTSRNLLLCSDILHCRNSTLTMDELHVLADAIRSHAVDRWARYGERSRLPQPWSRRKFEWPDWPDWPVTLVKDDCEAEEDDEADTCQNDESDAAESAQAAAQAAGMPWSTTRAGDPRAKAYADRLRRKVSERRRQAQQVATVLPEPLLLDSMAAGSELSATEVCAVCLCTEAELGKPFQWVLEKCGHKCICKPCLRKMKMRQKRVQVECPLCRVRSKPVLRDRYRGDIFAAEADP